MRRTRHRDRLALCFAPKLPAPLYERMLRRIGGYLLPTFKGLGEQLVGTGIRLHLVHKMNCVPPVFNNARRVAAKQCRSPGRCIGVLDDE